MTSCSATTFLLARRWPSLLSRAALCGCAAVVAAAAQAATATEQPLARLETGMHTAVINRVATDSAGRWAVTASQDRTARVWDVASGRPAAVLRPPQDDDNEGKLFAVAMSPDGALVAVAGRTQLGSPSGQTIYLFDRASARLVRRMQSLPEPILHLAYSPDGRWLAASLQGKGGVRVFDAAGGVERGRDTGIGDNAYSVHFSADSKRLVSSSYDGQVRVHALEAEGALRLVVAARPAGGARPYAARFSPDGQRIAVGFDDGAVVQVLDAQTLAEVARPSSSGVAAGNLARVAWSADGRSLLAGGSWASDGGTLVRRWAADDWSRFADSVASRNAIADLVALPASAGGGWLVGASDPRWGVLDASAKLLRQQDAAIVDFRQQLDRLQVSADGRRVRFGVRGSTAMRSFDVPSRALEADATPLPAARTEAPGLAFSGWRDGAEPRLNGQPLVLDRHETCRSLAIAPDGRRFVVGSEWNLRLFDGPGKARWRQPVPGAVWAVNVSGDGRFVVAAFSDGTIRWHRFDDGRELLALYPHADDKRWVAWTPEGYFDAAAHADGLIGYHLNHGTDREGEFVSARQLWETFYQPGLVARRLDADGDKLLREQVQRRGDVRSVLTANSVPELVLESAARATTGGDYELVVRVLRAGQGAAKLVVRVDDGAELAGRWISPALAPTQAPALTSGSVMRMPVSLADGQRKLSVELVDARGVASKAVTADVTVKRTDRAGDGTLHVLAVGVSNYPHVNPALKFAATDARAVASRLAKNGGARFDGRVVTRTLTESEATVANIGRTLTEMATKARPEDTFVLFMAGHGTLVDEQYYFLPWELNDTSDAAVRKQAIGQQQLRDWLGQLPLKSLLLLDTCRAGQAVQLAAAGALAEEGAVSTLSRLSQRNMIVASSRDNVALEGYNDHGVFSWVVLDALDRADYDDNGAVEVSDIATHARKLVPSITEKVFKVAQTPKQNTPGEPFAVAVPLQKGK
jgi:WD40 repeat protein